MESGCGLEILAAMACRLVVIVMGELGIDLWINIDTPPLGRLAEGEAGRQ